MSKLTCLGVVAGIVFAATTSLAAPVNTETVVHDTTTSVEITLDASTVLCSSADYGALFLKILIPELAGLTLLDHQNFGAGAPCVASGPCQPGNLPEDILDPYEPTETVAINVKAVRIDAADATAQTCETYLAERVNVTIRGITFLHERHAPLGSRPFADCATTPPPAAGDDTAADDPGTLDTVKPADTGGCSTTGHGTGALFALGLLGAVVGRRRR